MPRKNVAVCLFEPMLTVRPVRGRGTATPLSTNASKTHMDDRHEAVMGVARAGRQGARTVSRALLVPRQDPRHARTT